MAEVNDEDVNRLAEILRDADNAAGSYVDQAYAALRAGVTLPPEPPKWRSQGSSHTVRYCLDGEDEWANAEHVIEVWDARGTGKNFPGAERLADHLNATSFTPEAA